MQLHHLLMAILRRYQRLKKNIGKPLSPYAITKYVNELYADIYSSAYGLETIGLTIFQCFWKKTRSKWSLCSCNSKICGQFLKGESPQINGDGSFSRDFTYIDNVFK